jgi:cytochrome c oxidase subunit IV
VTTESLAPSDAEPDVDGDAPGLDAGHGEAGHGEAEHHTDLFYVKIFLVLAVITGIEVGLSYADLGTEIFLFLMFVAMSTKFYIVTAHFMHLKTDNKLLTRLFYSGLVLAVFVYFVFLSTMQLFA